MKKVKIKKLVESENVDFYEFYQVLSSNGFSLDEVVDDDILREYICSLITEGYNARHILSVLEEEISLTGFWFFDMGNSANTPEPIDSKEDLCEKVDEIDVNKTVEILNEEYEKWF